MAECLHYTGCNWERMVVLKREKRCSHFPWHLISGVVEGLRAESIRGSSVKATGVEDAFWHLLMSVCLFQLPGEIFCLLPLSRIQGLWSDCPSCAQLLLHMFCHQHCQRCLAKKGCECDVSQTSPLAFAAAVRGHSSSWRPILSTVATPSPLLSHCLLSCCPCSSLTCPHLCVHPKCNKAVPRGSMNKKWMWPCRQLWAEGGLRDWDQGLTALTHATYMAKGQRGRCLLPSWTAINYAEINNAGKQSSLGPDLQA